MKEGDPHLQNSLREDRGAEEAARPDKRRSGKADRLQDQDHRGVHVRRAFERGHRKGTGGSA